MVRAAKYIYKERTQEQDVRFLIPPPDSSQSSSSPLNHTTYPSLGWGGGAQPGGLLSHGENPHKLVNSLGGGGAESVVQLPYLSNTYPSVHSIRDFDSMVSVFLPTNLM